jgi:AcrR family transcriptional regulator
MDEIRRKILEAVVLEYQRKGLKFTMDDIARELHMSKKTIYKVYRDKEQMLDEMVDFAFNSIKETETAILNDESLTTPEKVSRILVALPDNYKNIDFRMLYQLKDKYPSVYRKMNERLENGWEDTISLIEQGIMEGTIRNISIPTVKLMFESTIEKYLSSDVLLKENVDYQAGLASMIDILMYGLNAR